MTDKILLRVDEAADRISVGRSYLYAAIQRGELETVKLGRARRVPVAALNEFIERLKAEQIEGCQ